MTPLHCAVRVLHNELASKLIVQDVASSSLDMSAQEVNNTVAQRLSSRSGVTYSEEVKSRSRGLPHSSPADTVRKARV